MAPCIQLIKIHSNRIETVFFFYIQYCEKVLCRCEKMLKSKNTFKNINNN